LNLRFFRSIVSHREGIHDMQKIALINYINKNPETPALFPSRARVNIMDLNTRLETDPLFYARK